MSDTQTHDSDKDYECPMLILAVWGQIMTATTVAAILKSRNSLTELGSKALSKIGTLGGSDQAEKFQLNLEKIMVECCGWDEIRVKKALAQAKERGFIEGGPPTN